MVSQISGKFAFLTVFILGGSLLATETVEHKIFLPDGSIYITRHCYLTAEEAEKAVADGTIASLPTKGRLGVSFEAELFNREGRSLAKRRVEYNHPMPDHGSKPIRYECVDGLVRDGRVYMLLRHDYGYSDSYCFQVHSFENKLLDSPCIDTHISMERASYGPSCKKIELLSYDAQGNVEVLIHPRVGKDLKPYRMKFGPNGDPSNDTIK